MGQGNTRSGKRDSGEVMTAKEVAEYIKVSEKSVIRYIKNGTLPGKKLGVKYRCLRTEVDKALLAR